MSAVRQRALAPIDHFAFFGDQRALARSRRSSVGRQMASAPYSVVSIPSSVRAVENALGMEIPLNAQYIRNVILAAHGLHDHIVHFYHLSALDWVDVVSALKGNPRTTARLANSLSPWPGNDVETLTAVKEKLADFVSKGQLGIFTNGYWGHPAMDLPPVVTSSTARR